MGQSFSKANAGKSSAEFGKHHVVYDSTLNLYYKPTIENDTFVIREFRVEDGDTVHDLKVVVDYIVGSGQHTNSHMVSENGFLYQAPITFYTQQGKWDLAPGFEQGFNSRFARIIGVECITCHNGLPRFDVSSENRYVQMKEGIDCERCHGPGSIHVREKMNGNIIDTSKYIDYTIVNPKKLERELQMDLCQRCHLQGVSVVEDERNYHEYRPGMKLSEYMNVFLPRYSNAETQFIMASQADRLQMSACYELSEMTCITCHNPHVSVTETAMSVFNAKCLMCHNQDHDCSRNPEDANGSNLGCISCHMAQSESIDIPHVSITDHFIRRTPKNDKVEVDETDLSRIQDFIGIECLTDERPDDLLMAKGYLAFYEKFSPRTFVLDSAFKRLSRIEDCAPDAIDTKIHFLYLSKSYEPLRTYWKSCVKSNDLKAWTAYRVGEAFRHSGNMEMAIRFFNSAVENKPHNLDFLNKQAAALAALGRPSEARQKYGVLLKLQPRNEVALSNLAFLEMQFGNFNLADSLLKQAVDLDPDYLPAKKNQVGLLIATYKQTEALELLLKLSKQFPSDQELKSLINQVSGS